MSATWNLGGKTPEIEQVEGLLHADLMHHDIYIVGTQEALKSINMSMISPSKEVMN